MDRAATFIASATLVLVAGIIATGQETAQEWKIKRASDPDTVHFMIARRKAGSEWMNANDVPLSRFRGLMPEMIDRGGAVTFEYVQDAGSLICKGDIWRGRGSGSYTFSPNPQFVTELKRLGYDAPDEEQLFSMIMSGVTLEFARGVKDEGLRASTWELISLRNHGVTLNYIHDIREAGYDKLFADDVIALRNHGVKVEFLRELNESGYNLSTRQVVELSNHGVNSRFIRDLKSYGLHPSASDIVDLRNHGVTPEYLKGLKDAGMGGLFTSEVIDLKNHGVPVEFVEDAKSMGYSFSTRELIELRNCGVNGLYLRRLKESGMRNLSASQIAKLKTHGVD